MADDGFRITRREMLKYLLGAPAGLLTLSKSYGVSMAALGFPLEADLELSQDRVILWQGYTTVDTTWRDLRGNPGAEFPTVQQTTLYPLLNWAGYKTSNSPLNFRVLGRSVDQSGAPLLGNWRTIQAGSINTPAHRWFRLLIQEGYWDEYRIELSSSTPQQVFSQLTARFDYLPRSPAAGTDKKQVASVDTLLVWAYIVDTTPEKDLFGRTSADLPVIDHVGAYRLLVWTGVKRGEADIAYTVKARSTDFSGAPLGSGWLVISTGLITGAPNSWYRVVISQPDGLFYDQYRICAQTASGIQELRAKIVGVR
ncbi:MAG: hypothetical protein ABDI19_05995 [Armatimonadota bacterium]